MKYTESQKKFLRIMGKNKLSTDKRQNVATCLDDIRLDRLPNVQIITESFFIVESKMNRPKY